MGLFDRNPEGGALASPLVPSGSSEIGVLPNATFFKARNFANSADINLFQLDVSDNFILSGPSGPAVNVSQGILNSTVDGLLSANWSVRELYDDTEDRSANWSERFLYDASDQPSVKWGNRELLDASNVIAISWASRVALSADGIGSISWNSRFLDDSSGVMSLHWSNRILHDSSTNTSVDWESRQLIGADTLSKVEWSASRLLDDSELVSIKWDTRSLRDVAELDSALWGDRKLLADDGTTESVNWSDVARVTFGTVLQLFQAAADPGTASAGDIYFNTTLNKIKVYSGTAWETVTSV